MNTDEPEEPLHKKPIEPVSVNNFRSRKTIIIQNYSPGTSEASCAEGQFDLDDPDWNLRPLPIKRKSENVASCSNFQSKFQKSSIPATAPIIGLRNNDSSAASSSEDEFVSEEPYSNVKPPTIKQTSENVASGLNLQSKVGKTSIPVSATIIDVSSNDSSAASSSEAEFVSEEPYLNVKSPTIKHISENVASGSKLQSKVGKTSMPATATIIDLSSIDSSTASSSEDEFVPEEPYLNLKPSQIKEKSKKVAFITNFPTQSRKPPIRATESIFDIIQNYSPDTSEASCTEDQFDLDGADWNLRPLRIKRKSDNVASGSTFQSKFQKSSIPANATIIDLSSNDSSAASSSEEFVSEEPYSNVKSPTIKHISENVASGSKLQSKVGKTSMPATATIIDLSSIDSSTASSSEDEFVPEEPYLNLKPSQIKEKSKKIAFVTNFPSQARKSPIRATVAVNFEPSEHNLEGKESSQKKRKSEKASKSSLLPKARNPITATSEPSCRIPCEDEERIQKYVKAGSYFQLEIRNAFLPKGSSPIMSRIPTTAPVASEPSSHILEAVERKSLYIERSLLEATDDFFKNLIAIGQSDKKYILCCTKPNDTAARQLVILDQHAVDERIQLEKLHKEYKLSNGRLKTKFLKQRLVLIMKPGAMGVVFKNAGWFSKIGFVFRSCSEGLDILAVPKIAYDWLRKHKMSKKEFYSKLRTSVVKIIDEFCSIIRETNRTQDVMPRELSHYFNTMACKTAITFGSTLDIGDLDDIILKLSNCSTPFKCAHGRPVISLLARPDSYAEEELPSLDKLKEDLPSWEIFWNPQEESMKEYSSEPL